MPQLKLSYFNFHGGRAEPARLAMHIGGIAFEDHRFSYPEFAEFRKTTPFGQAPTIEVDGVMVTQSDAITRYVGKLTGLYPTDPFQALSCDEVLSVIEDAAVRLGPTYRMTGDAQKEARLALVNESMPMYLGWLQRQLLAHGGEYFVENRLTIADLKVFVDVRGLNSGRLDHVPTDLVEKVAPALNAHLQRIAKTPAVAEYYAKFGL
jgi:prostaglandin-H2 D-isomerase / glutathione transferase